ncbi:MAG: YceD family protein [Acidobacteriaceae bacterium]
MLITPIDLEREPLEFDIAIAGDTMDYGPGIRQLEPLQVTGRADLIAEHRGPRDIVNDIRLRASYSARFEVPCARCVEPVEHSLSGEFDLIFRPVGVDGDASERAISPAETEIGYYQESGLLLEDVLREQVLLSLPARTLCKPDCKGLCPRCGQNLNQETCNCETASADPRWNALSDLRSRIKT